MLNALNAIIKNRDILKIKDEFRGSFDYEIYEYLYKKWEGDIKGSMGREAHEAFLPLIKPDQWLHLFPFS